MSTEKAVHPGPGVEHLDLFRAGQILPLDYLPFLAVEFNPGVVGVLRNVECRFDSSHSLSRKAIPAAPNSGGAH